MIHSWVQKMNNSAALCLEIGQHDRAITSLAKALQISRSYINRYIKEDTEMETTCSASDCMTSGCSSFDGCILYSEDRHRHSDIHRNLRSMGNNGRGTITDNHSEETIRKRFLQRRQQRRAMKQQGMDSYTTTTVSSSHHKKDFFYGKLIQIPSPSVHDECPEESISYQQILTLSVISIFNLAVVCHLKAMVGVEQQPPSKSSHSLSKTASSRTDLHKALKLYEVAYKALEKRTNISEQCRRTSVQFRLILCNNLSQIHNLTGNRGQHERYLREVLSTTMSLIDSNRPWNNNTNSISNNNNNKQSRHLKCIDLEGFLANAAPLMTEAMCADAA
jgi:hypothetical protein